MIKTILPGTVCGEAPAVASKSHLHRLLICAALSQGETLIRHGALCEDIDATCRCLSALGAQIERGSGSIRVQGVGGRRAERALLDCGESGSTYRFLLPVACALGTQAEFLLSGRLPQRPVRELTAQMEAHGAQVSGLSSARVLVGGGLRGGEFVLPGNVSSQYITALLFAMPLTGEDCLLRIEGALESAAYVDLTLESVRAFGVRIERSGNELRCPGGQSFVSPGEIAAEGDWSNAAFALCAAAASGGCARIAGLNEHSTQGDKAVLQVIRSFGAQAEMSQGRACVQGGPLRACRVDISPIPDMAPAICIMGAVAQGETVIENAGRLRLKESDRIESALAMLRSFGARAWSEGDSIHIAGTAGEKLAGGEVDSFGDHRIAMAASCAAAICAGPVRVLGAECAAKSYPGFYEDLPLFGLREA
ncbi:MAG: 3-phosphoshikimate 1-carboxyvinyltransferase [Eubacteriales bacterium]|nr:3-phosphoshikimate 1-carboxyvinyltransferase [Eubacteriales bacterium]